MITPDYLNQIVHATEERVSELHEYLIGRIASHIASFFGDLENAELRPTEINQMHKMMESGKVYDDIQAEIIKSYPEIQKEVQAAFLNSAAEISEANTKFEKDIIKAEKLDVKMPDYDINGIPTTANNLNLTDFEVRLLEEDYKRTNGTIKNLTKTTANASQTTFIEACDKAMFKVQHGTSLSKAVIEAIQEMADKGVGVVLYGGQRTNIEVAIARAVRTGINQANADIVLQRCAELGVGYVKVSEHMGARVTPRNDYTNHSWWQGKVYSIDWNKPQFAQYIHEAEGHTKEIADMIGEVKQDYPDLVDVTGYGDIEGLCGVNCRHTFSAFYPNIMDEPERRIDPEANERRYKEEQQARAMERAIRKTKRQIAALEGSGLTNLPEVQEQLTDRQQLLQRQLSKYKEYCKAHRINLDGSRIKVSNGTDAYM